MANENVKIIIQEDNQTQPRGAGASSDIAYIPGLAIDRWLNGDEECVSTKNIPVLCNSISEFESHFGPTPYQMTDTDVGTMPSALMRNKYYLANDYDKSYIYAKELLNAGISVIYENIAAPEDSQKIIAIAEIVNQENQESHLTANPNGTYNYNACSSVKSETIQLAFKLGAADPLSDEIEVKLGLPSADNRITFTASDLTADNSDAGIVIENVYVDPAAEVKVIKGYKITLTDVKANLASVNFTFSITVAHTIRPRDDGTDFTLTIDIIDVDDNAGEIVSASRIEYLYSQIANRYGTLEDKNEYNVKYITSGGYPGFLIDGKSVDNAVATAMLSTAANRGDAVAIIDHSYNADMKHIGINNDSTFELVNKWSTGSNGTYGTMFTTYGNYTCITAPADATQQCMPGSFGYLLALATAIKTSPNWLAMAGVSRGIVPNLNGLATNNLLSNTIAENMQPKFGGDGASKSINAITNVKPYGLAIWGNRTLATVDSKGTNALNFLNTRNMISDIKKLAYNTAKSLMFEQNSDSLWLRFKSGITPLLEQLKSGAGISNYKIIKGTTKYHGAPLTNGEMAAVIKIYPIYAVEYFEITVVMADDDVTVE